MRQFSILVTLTLWSVCLFGQLNAKRSFPFLEMSHSARITGLGGQLISVADADVNLLMENPAIQNMDLHNALSVQHQFVFEGIQNSSILYAEAINDSTFYFGGIHYLGYGEFTERNDLGNALGTFTGGDLIIQVGVNRRLYDRLSLGASLKFVNSKLAEYSSSAVAMDIGAHYQIPDKLLQFGLTVHNIGFVIGNFTDNVSAVMPLNVQVGVSKQLQHLPLRFSMQFHHLNRWNLLYDFEQKEDTFGGIPIANNQPGSFDNFFRHFIFNAEFMLGKKKNFLLRLGYNHQQKQELSIPNVSSLNGISGGFGFRVSKFRFDYGFRRWHYVGSTHHLGLSTNLQHFKR